jgi:hypothetical protein
MANIDNANMSQDHTLSADHEADLELSSSSSASVQEYDDFEATTAVLNTNELLHMIIAEVPLKYRISIIWKAAVTKVGYTLEPSGYRRTDTTGYSGLPMVSSIATFEINSAFPDEEEMNEYRYDYHLMTFFRSNPHKKTVAFGRLRQGAPEYYQRCVPSASESVGHKHEFITIRL